MQAKHASSRKALGRGLDALMPPKPQIDSSPASDAPGSSAEVRELQVDRIDPNPYQPRRKFRSKGFARALAVYPHGRTGAAHHSPPRRFEVCTRCRRASLARRKDCWASNDFRNCKREVEPERVLEVTLVENIQREDLNPIEIAQAFDRMIQELHLSHEEVATRTGKDRSTITNLLRLLRLPRDVQQLVAERRISGGHARAILGLEDATQQIALAEKAAAQGLSVRQVERTVRSLTESRKSSGKTRQLDPNVAAAVAELEQRLGTKVRLIQQGRHKGKIELEYYSEEDLERIYSIIMGNG